MSLLPDALFWAGLVLLAIAANPLASFIRQQWRWRKDPTPRPPTGMGGTDPL